ncbi:PD-(D/E)XK motif protein [Methanosarcina mazei]|jgi:hypothetical protein|uniref:PD-(D/E)XK motif protein n=1 Tax=Methanosarcina mazei TaxID=2209 RepID=A0A0F8F0U2_METMZ|nr:PD-(D/E)XK motif protein [Methanosarcina mazei]KKG13675.1 hypothetical protein DU34_11115 [Methanosarcina mazei]KKG28510.1 hypothetical protein DU49_07105 [Methanosarcina mazei]KKG40838.1 hypothetical protein DU35_06475 [Methanosarcina mazei]KKG45588.1 hypothetical protein DU39_07850 [Methanosarcina mazei]KKG46793.1 hypothetical protein DU41_05440 [Methanosarcina mazei]
MIEEIWKSMEEDSVFNGESCVLKRRVYSDFPFDLFLAMEKPENSRLFLLKVSRSNIPNINLLPRSRGFELKVFTLPEYPENYAFLEIKLIDLRFSDIFSILVNDILKNLNEIAEERELIKSFIERIIKWQQFLEKYGNEGLSEKAQRGLYGELWFLRKYMLPYLGIQEGIASWKGPEGKPQDFQFLKLAVEVKTTVGKQHQKISISNEQQLDDTGLDRLFLEYLSLVELNKGAGETLQSIVEEIKKLISSDLSSYRKFIDLLVEAGYLEEHGYKYSNFFYTVRSSNIFEVKDDFPRIIEYNLPHGVGDVHYSICVAECMRYKIEDINFKSFVEARK